MTLPRAEVDGDNINMHIEHINRYLHIKYCTADLK